MAACDKDGSGGIDYREFVNVLSQGTAVGDAVALAALKQASQSALHGAVQSALHGAVQSALHGASHTAVHTASHVASHTASHAAVHAASHTASHAKSHTALHTALAAVKQGGLPRRPASTATDTAAATATATAGKLINAQNAVRATEDAISVRFKNMHKVAIVSIAIVSIEP